MRSAAEAVSSRHDEQNDDLIEQMVMVRNSFLEVCDTRQPQVRRSQSDSDISSSHESKWQGSMSQSGSTISVEAQRIIQAAGEESFGSDNSGHQAAVFGKAHIFHPKSNPNEEAALVSSEGSPNRVQQLLADRFGQTTQLLSVGSVPALHESGECNPCSFFRRGKCLLDASCGYCHYPHAKPPRQGKKVRAALKKRRDREAAEQEQAQMGQSSWANWEDLALQAPGPPAPSAPVPSTRLATSTSGAAAPNEDQLRNNRLANLPKLLHL